MHFFYLPLILVGFYPLYRAWQANYRTSLCYAVIWAAAAWSTWGLALVVGSPARLGFDPWRYTALGMTAAAGVAVLGARRPQAGPWNFVILGLLAVMWLPLGEFLFLGLPPLDGPRVLFLGATLAVTVLNYLPTAFAWPALFLSAICMVEILALFSMRLTIGSDVSLDIMHLGLLFFPWLAQVSWRRERCAMELNQIWFDFRDRFGLFWAQRVRDQYNSGATNAGLPGFLFWRGWKLAKNDPLPTAEQTQEMQALLNALLHRFGEV